MSKKTDDAIAKITRTRRPAHYVVKFHHLDNDGLHWGVWNTGNETWATPSKSLGFPTLAVSITKGDIRKAARVMNRETKKGLRG